MLKTVAKIDMHGHVWSCPLAKLVGIKQELKLSLNSSLMERSLKLIKFWKRSFSE